MKLVKLKCGLVSRGCHIWVRAIFDSGFPADYSPCVGNFSELLPYCACFHISTTLSNDDEQARVFQVASSLWHVWLQCTQSLPTRRSTNANGAHLHRLSSSFFLVRCIQTLFNSDMAAAHDRRIHVRASSSASAGHSIVPQGTVQSRLRQLHSLAHDIHQLQPDEQFLEWERDTKQVRWGQRAATTYFISRADAAPLDLERGLQHKHTFVGLNTGRKNHSAAHAFTAAKVEAADCHWEVSDRAKPTGRMEATDADMRAEADHYLSRPEGQGAEQATRSGGRRTDQEFSQSNISTFTSTDARQSSTSSSPTTERKKRQSARDLYAQYQISRPSG